MYIPLIQLLIDAIARKDGAMTRLYGLAVIPQAAQCRTTTYNRLRDYILLSSTPKFDKADVMLGDLQEIYSCFGLTCDDIGDYLDKPDDISFPKCISAKADAPLAGYQPSTEVLSVRVL